MSATYGGRNNAKRNQHENRGVRRRKAFPHGGQLRHVQKRQMHDEEIREHLRLVGGKQKVKVSLIDFDNTGFPNLALMKISANEKQCGNEVKFYEPLFDKPDLVYMSKVFKFNKFSIPNVPGVQIYAGGTGFDWGQLQDEMNSDHSPDRISIGTRNKLTDEQEHICPDYSLYGINYSIGFITRGCIRKCEFCIVPSKEGAIRFNAPIEEFQRHKKVVLLDNNILACEEGIDELYKISKTDTKIDVNQGLDFRLVDDSIAELLAKLKWIRYVRASCDSDAVFERVKKSVEALKSKGIKPYRIFCYTLVKGENDVQRILELDKLGIQVFAMGYMNFKTGKKSQIIKDICRWCNRKEIFKSEKNFTKYRGRK